MGQVWPAAIVVWRKNCIHSFIAVVVTAATGVKKRSGGQGLFLVSVKRSRTIFKLGNAVKMVAFYGHQHK